MWAGRTPIGRGSSGPHHAIGTDSISRSRRSTPRLLAAGLITALLLAYVGPVQGYFEQRSELHRQQAHLTAQEADQRSYIAQLVAADTPEVLETRAREQGLVRPGERAFAIRGELDPPPPAVKEDDGGGGIFGWLPDIL